MVVLNSMSAKHPSLACFLTKLLPASVEPDSTISYWVTNPQPSSSSNHPWNWHCGDWDFQDGHQMFLIVSSLLFNKEGWNWKTVSFLGLVIASSLVGGSQIQIFVLDWSLLSRMLCSVWLYPTNTTRRFKCVILDSVCRMLHSARCEMESTLFNFLHLSWPITKSAVSAWRGGCRTYDVCTRGKVLRKRSVWWV